MQGVGPRLILAGALLAGSGAVVAQTTEEVTTIVVDAEGAAIIVFLPLAERDSANAADVEARAQVGLAIGNAKRCLGEGYVQYQVVFSGRIVVRWPGHEETFQVSDFAPLVGALLVRPADNPRVLFAGGGPEALIRLLPSAASEYFGMGCLSGYDGDSMGGPSDGLHASQAPSRDMATDDHYGLVAMPARVARPSLIGVTLRAWGDVY